MKILIKRIAVVGFAVALLSGSERANADPIGDFFKRLGNSIAHPQKKTQPRPRRTSRKDEAKESTTEGAPSATATPASVQAESPLARTNVVPPNRLNVRVAATAPPAKDGRRDAPYGIPVPGKQGFVNSPFAPNAGYVDVRGFAPGTEVKDPYTGKIFLAP